MPRNGQGDFSLIPNSWNPAVNGVVATAADWQALITDIAAAIAQSVSKDGQTVMTGPLQMGNNRIRGLGAPVGPGDSLRREQIAKGVDIPSAATITIPDEGSLFRVTGTTPIGAFDGSYAGRAVYLQFEDEVILEHGATISLPNDRDRETEPGEILQFLNVGGGVWELVVGGGGAAEYQIGDFLDTARALDDKWLRRNGGIYEKADYPILAALLPPLPDGIIWESKGSGVSGSNKLLMQGPGRYLAASDSGADTTITASPDGEEWAVIGSIQDFIATGIAYGLGVYVAADGNGKVAISMDGADWDIVTTVGGGAFGFSSLAFGNGKFVGVGVGGKIYTTADGTNWTQATSGTTAILYGVSFVNGTFVITGNGGVVLTSTDAITWTVRTTGSSASLRAATYANGLYVVAGDSGTILTSSNLSGWTPRNTGVSVTLNDIAGGDLGFVAVGANGTARISGTNAATWGPAATGTTAALHKVLIDTQDNAKHIVVGPPALNLYGLRTRATQFRVPNDKPDYGWIKALD